MLECRRVLAIQQLSQIAQSTGRRRRHHAVRVRPQLMHALMLGGGAASSNPPEERTPD